MSVLTQRFYQGEADLIAIADLINLCDQVDQLQQSTSVAELRSAIDHPYFDPRRDLCLWEDSQGQLLAASTLGWLDINPYTEGMLMFQVHPQSRGQGLEQEVMRWAVNCREDLQTRQGTPVRLTTMARIEEVSRIQILQQAGFQEVRQFFRMTRSLQRPIPDPQFPAGFRIRTLEGEEDLEGWCEMYNQTFVDHWNFHPWTIEQMRHVFNQPDYRPDFYLIAIAPDQTFAAFCTAAIFPTQNERDNTQDGWIAILGTRRGFRHLGLGRAMLLSGLHCLQQAGMNRALLGVDSEYPSGALAFYESVGFEMQSTTLVFSM